MKTLRNSVQLIGNEGEDPKSHKNVKNVPGLPTLIFLTHN